MAVPPKPTPKRRAPRGRPSPNADVNGFRRAAGRLTVWAIITLLCMTLIGGTLWGLNRVLLVANPHFTLRHITVEGNQTLSAEVVRKRLADLGAVPGDTNILTVPVAVLRRELESDPLIAEARILRRLPDTVNVTIMERTPIAAIQCAAPCFVDGTGIVLPWRDVSKERVLPLITGVRSAHKLKPGMEVHDDALRGAVRLLRLLASRPDGVTYDVAVIQLDYYLPSLRLHLRPRGAFRDGAIVVIPVAGMEEALNRLRDIYRLRADEGLSIGYVDASYQKNVPVRP